MVGNLKVVVPWILFPLFLGWIRIIYIFWEENRRRLLGKKDASARVPKIFNSKPARLLPRWWQDGTGQGMEISGEVEL